MSKVEVHIVISRDCDPRYEDVVITEYTAETIRKILKDSGYQVIIEEENQTYPGAIKPIYIHGDQWESEKARQHHQNRIENLTGLGVEVI